MDSGSDSNKSQEYPQWALNPSAYQNMANNQVDWAALAQQWITMKEAGIPPIGGDPSLSISEPHSRKRLKTDHSKDGGGNGIETIAPPPIWNTMADPPVPPGAADYWDNHDKTSWGWNAAMPNNTWIHPAAAPPPPVHKNIGINKPSLLPTPNSYINQQNDNTNTIPFNNYNQFNSSENNMSNNYWDGTANVSKQIKPHNKRFSKVNVPVRAPITNQIELAGITAVPDIPATPILDAAKRKQLPAWIKEGLEKMEKDKLKQMEKEKQKKQKEEIIEKTKSNNKDSIELLKTTMKERQKSKFDSDSENSDDDDEASSRLDSRAATPEPPVLTPEELMLKIRRTMTDLLLKVTDIQIEQICREELQRSIKKRSKDSSSSTSSSSSGRSKMYSSSSNSSKSRFSRHHESSSSRSRRSSSPRPD